MATEKNESFALVAKDKQFAVSKDLAEQFDEEDFEGYDAEEVSHPIIGIRQKDLLDANGNMLRPAGGFKMHNPVGGADKARDIDGDKGLVLTFLLDWPNRVYFKELGDKSPACSSPDGATGQGTPGGECAVCPLGQIVDKKRGKCSAQKSILSWDNVNETLYILQLGPSALRVYRDLKQQAPESMGVPLMALKVHVTTQRVIEPAPHYIPVFDIGVEDNTVTPELYKQLKELKKEIRKTLDATMKRAVESTDEGTETKQPDGEPPF